jgi:myo-inositol-1(or 4)-monophosphatase
VPRSKPKPVRRSRPSAAQLAAFAETQAMRIGRWLSRARSDGSVVTRMTKGEGDPVTELDLEAERRLRAATAKAWPSHGFLGEETGATGLDRDFVWIVDPIDGTANFAADLMPWGVAVACVTRGSPIAAAVYCMPQRQTMVACAGSGAHVNGHRLTLSSRPPLGPESLVGVQWFRGVDEVPFLPPVLATGTRVRVFGSTVTQMCDVAAGRLDANVQSQGRVWDIAAPALVVMEAGGEVTDWQGRSIFPLASLSPDLHHPHVCGTAAIVRQMVDLLRMPRRLAVPPA